MRHFLISSFLFCAALSFTVLKAEAHEHVYYSVPGLISVPDCNDGFTMDVRPRRNPGAIGTLTGDGFPVMLDAGGNSHFIMPRGMKLPDVLLIPGVYEPIPDLIPPIPGR